MEPIKITPDHPARNQEQGPSISVRVFAENRMGPLDEGTRAAIIKLKAALQTALPDASLKDDAPVIPAMNAGFTVTVSGANNRALAEKLRVEKTVLDGGREFALFEKVMAVAEQANVRVERNTGREPLRA